MKINNVVVIGSGTMGSGIAAHLCNANIPVTLLDLKTEISTKARDRIYKSRPPLLIDKSKINNINVGNIDDDFDVVKDADWIVEAVVERIDIKHNIYEKIFKTRKDGSIVSSNTSSIPIKVLSEKLDETEKKDFCITHFFNPSILDFSNKSGGFDFNILSRAFSTISFLRSSNTTGIFALHKWAAIPLPIVPDPIITTFFIFINEMVFNL